MRGAKMTTTRPKSNGRSTRNSAPSSAITNLYAKDRANDEECEKKIRAGTNNVCTASKNVRCKRTLEQ
jgi:hypothetical protein